MITRELIKDEIDKVQDKYLDILYRIIKALVTSPDSVPTIPQPSDNISGKEENSEWHKFVANTYACFADEPLERGEQGQYEARETVR